MALVAARLPREEPLRPGALYRGTPMAPTLVESREWDETHWFYRGLKRYVRGGIMAALRVRHRGTEHVPREGGLIAAINHQSWFDPIAVCAVFPRPLFHLAKEKLFTNPVKARFFLALGQIPVDRFGGGNEAAVERAGDVVRAGKCLGVYPEGTRSRDGRLLKFRPGAARVGLATMAPIVPVGVLTRHFFRKGALLPRVGAPVYVNVGEPFTLDKFKGSEPTQEVVVEATEYVRSRVGDLLHECEQAWKEDSRWE